MSSFLGSQPDEAGFLPPQSAQPRPSIFGGLNSDVDPQASSQQEPPRRSIFGGPFSQYAPSDPFSEAEPMDQVPDHGENELDMIMREQPIVPHDDSADEDFPDVGRGRSRLRRQRPVRSQKEPIYFVVDRGLDLPPGVERPNMFTGDAHMWRHYNSDDIGAYNAIITNRSRDLAAHLYNSHVLRRRTRGISRKILEADEGAPPVVHGRWAAWPVHASKVPRVDEILHKRPENPEIIQMATDPRSSARLEQCITAVMLRASKEKFKARETDFEEIKNDPTLMMDDGDELMEDELKKNEDDEFHGLVDRRILEPIIKLDDDEAYHQVRPLVRNVISQVDRLLHGLHCAMKGRKYEDDSDEEQSSDSDEEHQDEKYRSEQDQGSRSRSRSRGRQETQQGSQEREISRRSNSTPTSSEEETDDESLRGFSQSRDPSHNSPTRHMSNRHFASRLKLRDWSEIVGLASIMGLPTPAVIRASKRCADLFGEDIEFRTLPEGRVRKRRKTTDEEEYAYTECESDSESDSGSEGENDGGSHSAPPRPPPISLPLPRIEPNPELESMTVRRKPGEKRSKSKMTPAIVPHSESPSPPPEGLIGFESTAYNTEHAIQESRAVKLGVGKGPHRKLDLVCPIRTCIRHTDGFSRKWNLNLHLRRGHQIHDINDTSGIEALNRQL